MNNAIVTFGFPVGKQIVMPTAPARSPHTDTACRDADTSDLIGLILLRQASFQQLSDDHPHRPAIMQARDNAVAELRWRIWYYEGALKMNGIGLILAGP